MKFLAVFAIYLTVLLVISRLSTRNKRGNPDKAYYPTIGPIPKEGETMSRHHLRWSAHALKWSLAGAVALWLFGSIAQAAGLEAPDLVFMVTAILFFFMAMMGAAASAHFAFKALASRLLGPNPTFQYVECELPDWLYQPDWEDEQFLEEGDEFYSSTYEQGPPAGRLVALHNGELLLSAAVVSREYLKMAPILEPKKHES
jgi:hypothetical protein